MRSGFALFGFGLLLSAGPALAASVDCAKAEAPVEQLICREAGLSDAAAALDRAMAALGETTDAAGREALNAAQAVWANQRNQTCQVVAADLADADKARERAGCLLRAMRERTAWAERERTVRLAPVAGIPLSIADAAARPLAPIPARPTALTRPVTPLAMVGRWAKADPVNRAPLDDCRTSYLEVTRDLTVGLFDPRIPGLPVEGKLSVSENVDPGQGLGFASEGGMKGTLRLEAAETPRVDRLFLRLEQPVGLGATYVRCR